MVLKKVLVVIFILVFLLRLPSLFEPFTYGDEGIYLTLGQAVRQGTVLYREIHDNKPPLLYWFAALSGNFTNFRLFIFIWSFLTVYLFFKLAQQVFRQNQLAAILATILFAILTSIHSFEGNVANAENFMLLPIVAGFWLILRSFKLKDSLLVFLSGILFSVAVLFKVPAGFDFLAALAFIFLVSFEKKLFIRQVLYAILGFSLPILLTLIYFAFHGALQQYLFAAFLQNIPYLSSWGMDQKQAIGLPIGLISRALLVGLVVLALFVYRKKASLETKLVLIWFSFSLFAALLSSRPYPHYLLQAMPSLSLSFGLVLAQSRKRIIPFVLAAVLIYSFFSFDFWRYPNVSYYLNFYQFAFQVKPHEEYIAFFGREAETIYPVATYIQARTQPQDKIFIWGTQPSIYVLARRLPVGRYTAAYHIVDFNGYQETTLALEKNDPPYIVKIKTEKNIFPDLEAFLKNNYLKVKTIGEAEIYRKMESFN